MVLEIGLLLTALKQLAQMIGLVRAGRGTAKDHPTQAKILRFVEDHPGITLQEIDTALNLNRGTASYHLHRLRRQRLVAIVRSGRETHFFLSETWPDVTEAVSALHERCLSIATAVTNRPGTHQKELLEQFHTSRKVIRPKLDLMVQRELLEEKVSGRYRKYYPTTKLQKLLPFLAWRKQEDTNIDDEEPSPGPAPEGRAPP